MTLKDSDMTELLQRPIVRTLTSSSEASNRHSIVRLELQLTEPTNPGGVLHSKPQTRTVPKDGALESSPFSDPFVSPEEKPAVDLSVPTDVIRTVRTAPARREDVYQEKVEVIEQALSRLHRRQNTAESEPAVDLTPMSSTDSLPSASELMNSAPEMKPKSEGSVSSGDCTSVLQATSTGDAVSTGFMNLLHVSRSAYKARGKGNRVFLYVHSLHDR